MEKTKPLINVRKIKDPLELDILRPTLLIKFNFD